MSKISNFLPVTCLPIQYLVRENKKNYFVIKSSHSHFQKFIGQAGNLAREAVISSAILVMAVASPIFLLIDGTIHLLRKAKVIDIQTHLNDFHYFFNSKIYKAHLDQLQSYTAKLLKESPEIFEMYQDQVQLESGISLIGKTIDFVRLIIDTKNLDTEILKRKFHEDLTDKLRELVYLKQHTEICNSILTQCAVDFIDAFCEWFYTGPDLMQEMSDFVLEQLPHHQEKLEKTEMANMPLLIKEWHKEINSLPKFNGIWEGQPRLYDPRRLGDVPSKLFTHHSPSAHSTLVIRTPTITADADRAGQKLIKTTIVGEFRGFLDSYKKQGKKHLYINLMQRHGSEGIRSKAIEDLEKHYSNTLNVVTLTKDFDFYCQHKPYDKISHASTFKQLFLDSMFKKEGHYHWSPQLLENDSWRSQCKEIINEVHQRYYLGKKELSQKERRDFIEVTYTAIIDALIERIQPNSCNISCKSCIDRGAAMLAEQYSRQCPVDLTTPLDIKQKRLIGLTLAPALISQNRVMQSSRISRYVSAALKILKEQYD